MKRKRFGILTALLLLVLVTVPASALTVSGHVTDNAGILWTSEFDDLESRASAISQRYDFGVYIITIDDYRDYTGGDIMDAGIAIYNQSSLGLGNDRDGLLLLLSMEDRDYTLLTHGEYGNYVFTDDGREAMTACFLDDFQDDAWYDGFSDYLDAAQDYLQAAEGGQPYTGKHGSKVNILLVLLLPLAVSGVVIAVLNGKMKTVAAATEATAYVSDELKLTRIEYRYTHTTETRTKIESSNSGGGSSSRSSGSFSGTSGKF